eukprot:CAMPEP_0197469356 /NCGR_PEP_ID=MMETSP1175-20131217/66562_1 /TAXON_ID=1003142 /ORGANISM="Triceratium dubium, Strain CCMP147" /LENGTH=66 /DNA_ID=CAMNT_0043005497 /DNA_START=398 /DNA_END=598 /DNA_ORIENTATION=-
MSGDIAKGRVPHKVTQPTLQGSGPPKDARRPFPKPAKEKAQGKEEQEGINFLTGEWISCFLEEGRQ